MRKTIVTVFAFVVLFGFAVSSSIAQTWTWQYAPVITPSGITELTANPATDELYGLSGGSVALITTGVYTTSLVQLTVGELSNFSDIAVGFQGSVYAITDTAVVSCVPPAACALLSFQPNVPTDTGTFTHIAAGKDGKLFILYTEDGGSPQYILAGNPPVAAIAADVKITPQSLNLGSNGNWVSCRIGLPDGYEVKDIDPDSICITAIDGVGIVPFCRDPGSPSSSGRTLMVKFSRGTLSALLTEAGVSDSVMLTVSGAGVAGTEAFAFSGDDTIKVKAAKEKKEKKEKKPKKK